MTQPPDLTAPESTAPESTGSDTRDTSLTVRAPAVAGFFYPDSPTDIDSTASALIDRARQHTAPSDSESHPPRPIIVPPAGWRYSGDLAALGWAYAARSRPRTTRIVLLGPTHRVAIRGIALPGADRFGTPAAMLNIPTRDILESTRTCVEPVHCDEGTHRDEHALEVQVPFITALFGDDVELVPLNVGEASPTAVADVIDALTSPTTLIAVSSDLSHYHTYDEARRIDQRTIDMIERRQYPVEPEQACGARPMNGLLEYARRHSLTVIALGSHNSGDVLGGDTARVVGYAAFALTDAKD